MCSIRGNTKCEDLLRPGLAKRWTKVFCFALLRELSYESDATTACKRDSAHEVFHLLHSSSVFRIASVTGSAQSLLLETENHPSDLKARGFEGAQMGANTSMWAQTRDERKDASRPRLIIMKVPRSFGTYEQRKKLGF